ncbi:hypothetical protein FRC02_005116 [Tulasnella sp. 418]|nr:hypothetical protein FRC02_005116 [Tulasnella sp. 418]
MFHGVQSRLSLIGNHQYERAPLNGDKSSQTCHRLRVLLMPNFVSSGSTLTAGGVLGGALPGILFGIIAYVLNVEPIGESSCHQMNPKSSTFPNSTLTNFTHPVGA